MTFRFRLETKIDPIPLEMRNQIKLTSPPTACFPAAVYMCRPRIHNSHRFTKVRQVRPFWTAALRDRQKGQAAANSVQLYVPTCIRRAPLRAAALRGQRLLTGSRATGGGTGQRSAGTGQSAPPVFNTAKSDDHL